MTDLFRFVALRAPTRELPKDAIDLSTQSKFQTELAQVHDPTIPAVTEADSATVERTLHHAHTWSLLRGLHSAWPTPPWARG